MFRGYRVHIRSPERGSGHPRQRYGPNGPRGETQQPAGAAAPLIWAAREGKGKRGREKEGGIRPPPSFPPPSSFLPPPVKKERGPNWGGTPSRIRPTWGAPLWILPLPPTYIYVGRGSLADRELLLSCVRHPFHHLHPRSYFHSV